MTADGELTGTEANYSCQIKQSAISDSSRDVGGGVEAGLLGCSLTS